MVGARFWDSGKFLIFSNYVQYICNFVFTEQYIVHRCTMHTVLQFYIHFCYTILAFTYQPFSFTPSSNPLISLPINSSLALRCTSLSCSFSAPSSPTYSLASHTAFNRSLLPTHAWAADNTLTHIGFTGSIQNVLLKFDMLLYLIWFKQIPTLNSKAFTSPTISYVYSMFIAVWRANNAKSKAINNHRV